MTRMMMAPFGGPGTSTKSLPGWGKVLLAIGGLALLTLICALPVGLLGASQQLWGKGDQYGRVDVPGTAVINLPAGGTDVLAAATVDDSEQDKMPIPNSLALSVVSATTGAAATVSSDLATSGSAVDGDTDANASRRVFRVDVASSGDYRVRAQGDFGDRGFTPQLWFGHGPPISTGMVFPIAFIIALLLVVAWYGLRPFVQRALRDDSAAVGSG